MGRAPWWRAGSGILAHRGWGSRLALGLTCGLLSLGQTSCPLGTWASPLFYPPTAPVPPGPELPTPSREVQVEGTREAGEGEGPPGVGAGPALLHPEMGGGHPRLARLPIGQYRGWRSGCGAMSQVCAVETQMEPGPRGCRWLSRPPEPGKRMRRSSCSACGRSGRAGCAWTAPWPSSSCPAATWPVPSVRPACSCAPSAGPPSTVACAPSCPRPGEHSAQTVTTGTPAPAILLRGHLQEPAAAESSTSYSSSSLVLADIANQPHALP